MSEHHDLDTRIRNLVEAIVDEVNRDAETPDAPVMLSSYVLVVEGNGWTPDGNRITRGYHDYSGSLSQVKGLLIDTLDDLRTQDLNL